MSEKVSTRTGFGQGIMDIAEDRKDVLLASADTFRSFALNDFAVKYPDRYFEYGIAEQCMITSSAGMATNGYTVFCVGYSPFLSMRAVEQIRTFVAYTNQNVKIVAGLSGLSGDTDGVTHQGTEDISIMSAIPNMMIVSPSDAIQARELTKQLADIKGPAYLRLGRAATPLYYTEADIPRFKIGEALTARDYGTDAVIMAVGYCVGEAMKAADELAKKGINVRVLDFHTISPFDKEAAIKACKECGHVFTVEDGSAHGGLGGIVAEILLEEGVSPKSFKRLGLNSFGTAGTMEQLVKFFHIDADTLIEEIEKVVEK